MKKIHTTYYLILLFATAIGLWALPALVKMATDAPERYPFVYYSSVMKEMGIVDYKDKITPLSDMKGNKYTTAQFDSLMPLLNYRQLMADGRLPDSLGGYELTPPLLRSKSVIFRTNPTEQHSPNTQLYILFESMPKRVGLEIPDDVFRMTNCIEFVDIATNTVNTAKSVQFQEALQKAGYTFPARWLAGNPNPRKAYDEGYFSLDAKGDLFHLKMVNGRPFVRNTGIGSQMEVDTFIMQEASDKRYYGFLFSKQGDVHILTSNEGRYETQQLDIPPFNVHHEQFNIMGNLLYWTLWTTNTEGRSYYALDTESLKQVDHYYAPRESNKWDKVSAWLFPYYLTFQHSETAFIYPHFIGTGWGAFLIHLLLAVLFLYIRRDSSTRVGLTVYILLTGIAGFVAALLLPSQRKNHKL